MSALLTPVPGCRVLHYPAPPQTDDHTPQVHTGPQPVPPQLLGSIVTTLRQLFEIRNGARSSAAVASLRLSEAASTTVKQWLATPVCVRGERLLTVHARAHYHHRHLEWVDLIITYELMDSARRHVLAGQVRKIGGRWLVCELVCSYSYSPT